jgi:hypothetical protein
MDVINLGGKTRGEKGKKRIGMGWGKGKKHRDM